MKKQQFSYNKKKKKIKINQTSVRVCVYASMHKNVKKTENQHVKKRI